MFIPNYAPGADKKGGLVLFFLFRDYPGGNFYNFMLRTATI